MKILVINGPNLNLLGKRDPSKYGSLTLGQINRQLVKLAQSFNVGLEFFQSNCEGALIDFLQKKTSREADGILINPGALVLHGYSLRQALVDHGKPLVEVHMSDINKTGVKNGVNVLKDIRITQITGLKEKSYYIGLERLVTHLKQFRKTEKNREN